eukprot:490625-Amphidinium_carterae.1
MLQHEPALASGAAPRVYTVWTDGSGRHSSDHIIVDVVWVTTRTLQRELGYRLNSRCTELSS